MILTAKLICRVLKFATFSGKPFQNCVRINPAVTFVRIYPYTDFVIEMGHFKRRLTDTLRYLQHELFTCFRLLAAITQYVNQSEGKLMLRQVCCCFPQILETYDCRTKFNSSLGMEYNGELYRFSAVKVKLVDSSI